MRLLKLNETMKELVCAFDPFSLLEEPRYAKDKAYGIMAERGEGDELITGLMLVRNADGREPVVDWLYVAPEFRGGGIAGFAIDSLLDRALKNNADSVLISLKEFYGRDAVIGFDDSLFKERGFEEGTSVKAGKGERILKVEMSDYEIIADDEELMIGEYSGDEFDLYFDYEAADEDEEPDSYDAFNVDEALYKAYMEQQKNERTIKRSEQESKVVPFAQLEKSLDNMEGSLKYKAIPIADLSINELKEGIEEALEHKATCLVENILDINPLYFSPDLSFVVKDGEYITGILLVHINLRQASYEVCLVYGLGKDKAAIIKSLFTHFIIAGKKRDIVDKAKVVFPAQ